MIRSLDRLPGFDALAMGVPCAPRADDARGLQVGGAAEQHQRLVAEGEQRAAAGPGAVHEEREHVRRLLAGGLRHQHGRQVGQVFHGRKLTARQPPGQPPPQEIFAQMVKLLDTWAGVMYILSVRRPLTPTTSPQGSGGHRESSRLDPYCSRDSRRGRRLRHVIGRRHGPPTATDPTRRPIHGRRNGRPTPPPDCATSSATDPWEHSATCRMGGGYAITARGSGSPASSVHR